MRKVLLISLAAVILAGGTALVVYGQDDAPRRQRRPEGRPDGEGQRRGPPRMQLTEDQQKALQSDEMKGAMEDLKAAVQAFQAKVKRALKLKPDDERTARMVTMQAIMRQMRPPGDRDRERRDRPTERPKKRPE